MHFNIERVKRLENMATEMIYYYILNLSYIFQYSSWYYCSCNRFNGCQYQNGEENYCFICQFKLEYYPGDIEKIFDPREIGNIYISMKNDLKNVFNLNHPLVLSGIIILNTTFEIMKETNGFVI